MRLKNLLPLIGLVVFVFILFQLDFSTMFQIFSEIPLMYVILSFFVFVPLLFLVTIEWQLLLKRQQIHVSFWYSIKNLFIGYFYGFITPGGLGAYTRSLYLSKESGEPLAKCLSNIVTFNTIEYLALLSLGFIGAVFLSQVYPYLFLVILAVVVIVLSLYILLVKSDQSQKFFQKLINHSLFSKIACRLQDSVESFHKDVPNLKDTILPFSLSVTGWVLKYVMLFFIAQLFSISIPFYFFITILAVADVIASLPISIYGLGTREAVLITLFTLPHYTQGMSIRSEQIVSLSLFWFVIIWLIPSIIGAFVTIGETTRMRTSNLNRKSVKQFEQYMRKYFHLYQPLARIVKKLTFQINHPIILEIGAGPGLLSEIIDKEIPHAKMIGVDISKEMIDRSKHNTAIEGIIGSVELIPIQTLSVDIVVTRFSLTYWKKPDKGFQEINRVLKPGGFFIIEALNKDFSKVKLFFIKIHMLLNQSGWPVAQYHTDAYKTAYQMESVIAFFENNNFKIVQKKFQKNAWKFIIIGKKING